MVNSAKFVVYCGGTRANDTRKIAGKIIGVVNTLRADQKPLEIGHLDLRYWQDEEANHMFYDWERIRGRHAIFFLSARDERDESQLYHYICALKYQYGAKSVTLVMPFMMYRRQDRIEARKINRNFNFLRLIKAAGADKIILCDIHSVKTLENARKVGLEAINVDPTSAYKVALTDTMERARGSELDVIVYSPDEGSVGRSVSLARELGIKVMLNLKHRDVTGENHIVEASSEDVALLERLRREHDFPDIFFADESIKGAIIIMREDEANTCGTAKKTGKRLRELGAREIYLLATHPVLSPTWKDNLIDAGYFNGAKFGTTIKREYEEATAGFIEDVDMSIVIGHSLANEMETP